MLKGGSLLYAMNGLEARPTVDVGYGGQDQLWLGFPGSCIPRKSWVLYAMKDGVSFDAGSIKIEPITVEKKYFGTRFYFTAHLADRTRRL